MVVNLYYFAPIFYYKQILNQEKIVFEKHENFQKQTYHNRCNIFGANGKLTLSIPTQHNNERLYKEKLIAYDYKWQKEHLKSLASAYRSSPFFEFYEDEIKEVYAKKEKYLFDFNVKCYAFINKKLDLEIPLTHFTEQYSSDYPVDMRDVFMTKKTSKTEEELLKTTPSYEQVFSHKLGFKPNLSILDLLFNKGPYSKEWLKNN